MAQQLLAGQLEPAWMQVVISDVSAALVQGTVLLTGIFPGGPRAPLARVGSRSASAVGG